MNLTQRSRYLGLNLWLAIAAVGFVVAWRVWIISGERHLLLVATEIGSIAQAKEQLGNLELLPNHAGTGVVFSEETETGLGTYFHDSKGQTNKLLFEHKEKGHSGQFGMLAWSPDDRLFACALQTQLSPTRMLREILLFDGVYGEMHAKISADGFLPESKFIWLSPRSFAFTTYNQAWLVFEQKSSTMWEQSQVVKRFADATVKNLIVTTHGSVAWRQDDGIWAFDFGNGVKRKIWESTTNTLKEFTFSPVSGEFNLLCNNSLWSNQSPPNETCPPQWRQEIFSPLCLPSLSRSFGRAEL